MLRRAADLAGGAPGVGKTSTAHALLDIAARRSRLVQWIDVDALWLHQPWGVSTAMKGMLHANLEAVLRHADLAGVDDALVTWVFQDSSMHDLVRTLAPPTSTIVTVQLLAEESIWRARFEADRARPPIESFYLSRYADAQSTPADNRIITDEMSAATIAEAIAEILDW